MTTWSWCLVWPLGVSVVIDHSGGSKGGGGRLRVWSPQLTLADPSVLDGLNMHLAPILSKILVRPLQHIEPWNGSAPGNIHSLMYTDIFLHNQAYRGNVRVMWDVDWIYILLGPLVDSHRVWVISRSGGGATPLLIHRQKSEKRARTCVRRTPSSPPSKILAHSFPKPWIYPLITIRIPTLSPNLTRKRCVWRQLM